MREIEFRGRHTKYGHWVYGDLLTEYVHHHGATIVEGGCIYHEVHPYSVSRFTGLRDKNGAEVYPDDLLIYKEPVFTDCSETEVEEIRDPVLICIVIYHPLASIVKPYSEGIRCFAWSVETGEGLLGSLRSEDIEIIGNIHDNPELFGVAE